MSYNNVLLKYAKELSKGDESLPELIFTVGIPGSGKSTWIKNQKGYEVVSLDDIRRQLTGSISDQSKEDEVVNIGKNRIKQLLNAGKNVIYDGTNVKYWYRQNMLSGLPPAKLKAKIFHVDPNEAVKRIKKDVENKVDRSNVPPDVVKRLHTHFMNTINENQLQNEGFEII